MKSNMRGNVKKTAAVVLAASMVVGANGIPVMNGAGYAVTVQAAQADENGFVIEDGVLCAYQGTATEIVIPDGVTVIGEKVFQGKTSITSVTFPDSVTEIKEYAFDGCSSLSELTLPKELEILGSCVFKGCTGITEVVIPKTLEATDNDYTHIRGPFAGSGIKTASFEEGTITVAASVFAGCDTLERVCIPDNVTTVGSYAFCKTALTEIVIPDTVTKMEEGAFQDCAALVDVTLSENLEDIGSKALGGCTSLTDITIPKALEAADATYTHVAGPFAGSGLVNVEFEAGITAVAKELFAGCKSLKEITIPDTVTTIMNGAFRSSGLESVTISEYVTCIEENAFKDCADLAEVALNEYLEELKSNAFGNCTALTSIHIPDTLVESEASYTHVAGPFAGSGLLTVTMEEGLKRIADGLFAGAAALENVEIPTTVEMIGEDAFRVCTSLKEVEIPWSVYEIHANAFRGCSSLEAAEITDNVDVMEKYAFAECTSLKSVAISNRLDVIEDGAFYGDTALEAVFIPSSVKTVCDSAFKNCEKLQIVENAGSVEKIESQAFSNTGFEELELWEGITEIKNEAFASSKKLEKVTMPDSLVSLGTKAFYDCGKLTEVTFGTGLSKVPDGTFSDCSSLKKVIFPYGVKEIGTDIFHNCTSLTEVTIPKTADKLVDGMFSYPKKVTVYGVAGSAAESYARKAGAGFGVLTAVATDVALNESDIVMYNGQTKKMCVNVTPVEFTDDVTWSVSDAKVITVAADGTVEAQGVGEAVVTVTVGNVSATCKITVMDAVAKNTQKARTTVEAGKAAGAVVSDSVATIRFGENSVTSEEGVIVRSEKLGNIENAAAYKQADDILKAAESFNTDSYVLYDFSIQSQKTGMDVVLKDGVEVTLEIPAGMNTEKLVVARLKNASVMDADAGELEILETTVDKTAKTVAFETDAMGVFVVIEGTASVTGVMRGDVDGNEKVELADAQMALKAALKITTLEKDAAKAADVDGNGKIELADAQKILKVALKIEKFED